MPPPADRRSKVPCDHPHRGPGLPCAVWMAAVISSPPTTSHAPGSSATRNGTPTSPIAVLPRRDDPQPRVPAPVPAPDLSLAAVHPLELAELVTHRSAPAAPALAARQQHALEPVKAPGGPAATARPCAVALHAADIARTVLQHAAAPPHRVQCRSEPAILASADPVERASTRPPAPTTGRTADAPPPDAPQVVEPGVPGLVPRVDVGEPDVGAAGVDEQSGDGHRTAFR